MNNIYYSEPVLITESFDLFLESADPKVQKRSLSKLLDKLRTLLKRFQEWIREKFSRSEIKKVEKNIKQAVEADPSLKDNEVNVPDIKSIDKVDSEYRKEVMNADTEEKVEKANTKRKSKMKKIALIAIPITAVAGYLLYANKRANDTINEYTVACDNLKKYIDHIDEDIVNVDARVRGSSANIKGIANYNRKYGSQSSVKKAEDIAKQVEEEEKKLRKEFIKDAAPFVQKTRISKSNLEDLDADVDKYAKAGVFKRARSLKGIRLLRSKINALYRSGTESYRDYLQVHQKMLTSPGRKKINRLELDAIDTMKSSV